MHWLNYRLVAGTSLAAVLVLFNALPQPVRAQLVDITAEFRCTNRVRHVGLPAETNEWNHTVHCVVGLNVWHIEGNFARNSQIEYLFTGTNITRHVVLNDPHFGKREWTWTRDSVGAGVGEASQGNLAWLAFCSGPLLRQKDRVIPWPDPDGYPISVASSDTTTVFKDELGLPSHVTLSSVNRLVACQYMVLESTNFLGWTFPLRFELTQTGGPGGGDGIGMWDGEELFVWGQVKSIGVGRMPSIPVTPP
jgi:hypothetical protein